MPVVPQPDAIPRSPRAFGSRLLGPADQSLKSALRRSTLLTWGGLLIANLAGAAGAFVLASFVFPTEGSDELLVKNLVGVPTTTGLGP